MDDAGMNSAGASTRSDRGARAEHGWQTLPGELATRHADGASPRRPIVLLSNREPYERVWTDRGVELRRPPGGLVSALDPMVRRARGVWIAWGSGTADAEMADDEGRLQVPPPPAKGSYTLRRVWLDESDVEGYYLGFANSVLWPLCHLLINHLHFREDE